jgi:hypothetical protein
MITNFNYRLKLILSIYILFQFIGLVNSPVFAEVKVFQMPTITIAGDVDLGSGPIRLMKEVSRNSNFRFQDKDNFRLSANVSFKSQKRKKIFEQLPFKIDGNFQSSKEKSKLIFLDQDFIEEKSVKVNLIPDLESPQGNNPIQNSTLLADYDELWIEYQDLFDDNPAQIDISLALETETESSGTPEKFYSYLLSNNSSILSEVESEEISKATLKPRNAIYLFKHVLGLKDDNKWNYKQVGRQLVTQKRFNKMLSDVDFMDLVLDDSTKFELLNLRIRTLDDKEVIVKWDSLDKDINKIDNNRLRVRIYLTELKRRHKQPVLKELIIFLKETADEILENRPLYSIHWFSYDHQFLPNHNIRFLERKIVKLKSGLKRIQIDLSKIYRQFGLNSKLIFLDLELTPKQKNMLSAIKFSKISLNSFYEAEIPTIALRGTELLKRWDVETEFIANKHDLNVWPNIFKYSNTPQNLSDIDPNGHWIEIDWEVQKEIIEGSYLYIGGKEIQDKVLGIQATPYSFSGEILGHWFLSLNESVQLDNFKSSHEGIDYIKIRVYIDAPSGQSQQTEIEDIVMPKGNRSPITELSLFEVDNLSFDEILDAPYPLDQETFLNLEIEKTLSNIFTNTAQDGTTTFLTLGDEPPDGDLFFNTVIKNRNRSEEDSLVVSYKVPFYFPLIDKCWLEMTATGDGKEIQNKVCFDGYFGDKIVSLPRWVNQIKWRAILPRENNMLSNSDRGKFSLSIKLLTNTTTTNREQLLSQPILAIDNNKLFPLDAKFNKNRGNLNFDLDNINYINYIGDIQNVEHSWLEVEKIILNREESFSKEEWQELSKEELIHARGESFWLQLIKYLLLIVASWLLFVSGWVSKSFRALVSLFFSLDNLRVRLLRRFHTKVSWIIIFFLWSIVTVTLYAVGFLSYGMQGENYYFTFGSMVIVMAWHSLAEHLKPSIKFYFPELSIKVYSKAGNIYIFGSIIFLFGVAISLLMNLDFIAEQLAIISYFMLCVTIFIRIIDMKRNNKVIDKVALEKKYN